MNPLRDRFGPHREAYDDLIDEVDAKLLGKWRRDLLPLIKKHSAAKGVEEAVLLYMLQDPPSTESRSFMTEFLLYVIRNG